MLPRLQAEAQLAAIDATALGTGSYEQSDAQRMKSRLRDTAYGERQKRRAAANPAQLATMGVGVTILPAKGALSDV